MGAIILATILEVNENQLDYSRCFFAICFPAASFASLHVKSSQK
jgi:hypothetical protein